MTRRFFQWFPPPPDPDAPLPARLPGLDVERARPRLDQGRPFGWEAEVKVGPRTVHVALQQHERPRDRR